MPKEFTFRGKTPAELEKMTLNELAPLLGARERRTIRRGFNESQKKLLEKVRLARAGKYSKPIRTQCRDMFVVPEMFGLKINVHAGKEYVPLLITPEMIGHALGEFTLTKKEVKHHAPGIGATRSSKFISVK